MNFNLDNMISTALKWASTILLARLVLCVLILVVIMGGQYWTAHHNYIHDRQNYSILDNVRPSFVLNNRGCMMRFSESGVLEALKIQRGSSLDDCPEIKNIDEIIAAHKENARGINRPGSIGWQIVLAGIIVLTIFHFKTGSREPNNHSPLPLIVLWLALFPVTFGAIYTDYRFMTKATTSEYSGYVTTVYPATDGKWYPLPHTKIAKHIDGHVHTATNYTF